MAAGQLETVDTIRVNLRDRRSEVAKQQNPVEPVSRPGVVALPAAGIRRRIEQPELLVVPKGPLSRAGALGPLADGGVFGAEARTSRPVRSRPHETSPPRKSHLSLASGWTADMPRSWCLQREHERPHSSDWCAGSRRPTRCAVGTVGCPSAPALSDSAAALPHGCLDASAHRCNPLHPVRSPKSGRGFRPRSATHPVRLGPV